MDILEFLGITLLFGAIKELTDSMSRSKTLTFMVVVGLTFFVGFTLFLIKMAGAE